VIRASDGVGCPAAKNSQIIVVVSAFCAKAGFCAKLSAVAENAKYSSPE